MGPTSFDETYWLFHDNEVANPLIYLSVMSRTYGRKFSQFHAVFRKIWQIVCWRPSPPQGWRTLLRGILDPPLKNEVASCHSLQRLHRRNITKRDPSWLFTDKTDFGNYGVTLCPSDVYQVFLILWDFMAVLHIFRLY